LLHLQLASDVGTLQPCCTKSELGAVATSQTIKQREAFILVTRFSLSPGLVATAPSSDFVWRTLTLCSATSHEVSQIRIP